MAEAPVSSPRIKAARSDGPHAAMSLYPTVDPEAAEGLLAASHLGERIKKLRLKRSMGLVEMGRKTGLSASFLSQLETGRVVPTLRNLARIALVFGKDLSHFFEATEQNIFRVQRRKDRIRLPVGLPTPGHIAESFGILIPEGGLRPCMAEFLPSAAGEAPQPFYPHLYPGTEMIYLLSGSLEVRRKDEPHHLHARDVLYVSAETPRAYRCFGTKPAQALIISFDADTEPRRPIRRALASTTA